MSGTLTTLVRPSASARALGLLQATHPIPNMMFVAVVAVFSFLAASAAHRSVAPWDLARLLLGVFCAQAVIGAVNDYRDRELDAASRPSKPIVRGLVTGKQVLAVAAGCAAATALLIAPFGLVTFALAVLIVALGLAYDLGLKGSPASGVLYALHFPLFPYVAWAVFGHWQAFLPWLLPVGAALGVAMNISNTLPDLEEDLAHGVRGLPHVLGMRRSLLAAWTLPLVLVAFVWALNLSGVLPSSRLEMLVATGATVLSVALAWGLHRARPQPATLRVTFLVQAVGAVVFASAWVAAVS